MADQEFDPRDKKKAHRERHSGRKAEKKEKKKQKAEKQDNPKAFAFNSAVKAERRFRRKQDVLTKKYHVPEVDRTPVEPPPILVAVVGPPKVGKSTLINNLIKLFTKSPLTDIKGPITIVTGKKRRVTFIECNNDINCMIDVAKVADLVLLLCDASFGFEMEIFEFLNICQVHGMPRVMGILTHLDMIRNNKTLKNTKKTLKHRFWTEVHAGAKLFYLSGILHGEYMKNEIKNLGRFISVMKFRPLVWRTTHSYMLADRYEDLTNQGDIGKDPKCNRTVSIYGYLRGIPLLKDSCVHIAGLGDFRLKDISHLPDPCPVPDQVKKRALIEKEKLIYSPFSGIGGIVYDKDAVYIDLQGSHRDKNDNDNEANAVISDLIETELADDLKTKSTAAQLFGEGMEVTAENLESIENDEEESLHDEDSDDDSEVDLESVSRGKTYNHLKEQTVEEDGRKRRKVIFDTDNIEVDDQNSDSESEDENDSDEADDYNEDDIFDEDGDMSDTNDAGSLLKHAINDIRERQLDDRNYKKIVYGVFDANSYQREIESTDNEDDEIWKSVSHAQQQLKYEKENLNAFESSLRGVKEEVIPKFLESQNKALIVNCFVTGKWGESEDASELLKLDDARDLSDDDSDLFGDFEDLETGEKHDEQPKSQQGIKRKLDQDEEETDDKSEREKLAEKKRKLKEKFDSEYDDGEKTSYYDELKTSADKQAQLNKNAFEDMPDEVRIQIEGFRPGMYVRMEFENIPYNFITNFDPTYPVVIGALNFGEGNIGYVNVRIKKHRWYNRILKTNDPIIVSLGWRRFQTIPIYSKLEDDMKFRYLKYTPLHVGCNAHFWGPITPPGTGILAVQSVESDPEILKKTGFRIAATGVVQELDKSTQIMKKLKLIGHPLKIYKKTAFIKDMFHNSIEVAKFEGARIRTVSGIRGQIKKAVSKPEGCFRGTFEDKILLSDIVFCRTWFKVDVKEFYKPVKSLLLPVGEKNSWRGLRTVGELKREKQIRNAVNKDSLYTPIEREEKPFKPLVIPAKLQEALPYRDKPNHGVKKEEKKKSLDRPAVLLEPKEKEVANMMKMIKTNYRYKQEKLKSEMHERVQKHKQRVAAEESFKDRKLKQKKKEVFRKRSKAQAKE